MSTAPLSRAAARAQLVAVGEVRLRTVGRWVILAAIPIIPTMVELAHWPVWIEPPLAPSFHIIYWWAVLVLAFGAYETYQSGRRRERWLEYWQERGRILGGNVEEIALVLLGSGAGGRKVSSPDLIAAGILQQIADVVRDLTKPDAGVHIMACLLEPQRSGRSSAAEVVALQATVFNQNVGRSFSRLDIGDPGPATEAFRSGTPQVVADMGVDPYGERFEGRPYRSVMAYPVKIGGLSGQRLAVVTVDASQPGHFVEGDRVEKGIDAAIFPLLKLLGMLLIAQRKGGRRDRSNGS
jgi:hypothetical protein